MNAVLDVQESTLATVRAFLRQLMEEGIVDSLMVPQPTAAGNNVVQTLVRNPAWLEKANPIAPVLPVNSGTLAGNLTATGAPGKVGLVMRSCEIRALVELHKLLQAKIDEHVLVIGVDCLGTYEVADYAALTTNGQTDETLTAELLAKAKTGDLQPHEGMNFRVACQMCEYPVPGFADGYQPDITLGFIGLPNDQQILVTVRDEALAEKLGLTPAEVPEGRQAAVDKLVAGRVAERDRRFAAFRERVHDIPSLLNEFSTCIRCLNCMNACPICYCKECIFRTDTFRHESAQFFRWAERRGAIRLPVDTIIFHLTRLNHMATSCVGCGMCSSACPNDIPVAEVFRAVGQKVQAIFDYVPGRSLEEEVPLATFREDELTWLGERE